MKFVAQTFIILIMVMSLVLTGLLVAVYSTHTNWKEKAQAVEEQLKKEKAEHEAAKTKLDELKKEIAQEEIRQHNAVVALEDKVKLLTKDVADLRQEKDQLSNDQVAMVANIGAVHNTLSNTMVENTQLRELVRTLNSSYLKNLSDLVEKSKESQDYAIKLTEYRRIGSELAQQYAGAKEVIRKIGAPENPAQYSGPPSVKGIITDIQNNIGNNANYVGISIGEDDGLMKGHQLHVYRIVDGRGVLLGKVEVMDTQPNSAVCKVLPEFRQGNIQREDLVTTKFDTEYTIR